MCAPRCRCCDEPSGPNTTVPWSERPGICLSCAQAINEHSEKERVVEG
jgi:hypothetical protein